MVVSPWATPVTVRVSPVRVTPATAGSPEAADRVTALPLLAAALTVTSALAPTSSSMAGRGAMVMVPCSGSGSFTVTVKLCCASGQLAALAVTVMVVSPWATPVTVRFSPLRATLATAGSPETADRVTVLPLLATALTAASALAPTSSSMGDRGAMVMVPCSGSGSFTVTVKLSVPVL